MKISGREVLYRGFIDLDMIGFLENGFCLLLWSYSIWVALVQVTC